MHSNHCVNKKQHQNEQRDVRQGLEGLDERPQKGPDAFPSGQQLHQPHHTEQSEEIDGRNRTFLYQLISILDISSVKLKDIKNVLNFL